MQKTFWLSFADENQFAGVVIVDLDAEEIGAERPFFAAIRKSIKLKINPGPDYSVQGHELPPNEISEQFKNRLLAQADVELLNMRPQ